MKIFNLYIAYDGTRFDDFDDCEQYELYAHDMLMQILERCTFWSKKYGFVEPEIGELENMVAWINIMWDNIDEISLVSDIPSSAYSWWMNFFDYYLPKGAGTYTYSYEDYDWVKVE